MTTNFTNIIRGIRDQIRDYSRAFTIVELLVAMGLFIILIGIAAGSFVRVMRTQRAIVALMAANDNASLALEQMAREIRTSYNFSKPNANELQFVNAYGVTVIYKLKDKAIERGITDAGGITTYKKITADNVGVNKFKVELFGQNPGDGYPPKITVALSVTGANSPIDTFTDIQTTISARFLDN